MSTYTTNLDLELPARNAYQNTWDVPVNSNFSIIDSRLGGSVSIPLTSTNVTLTTTQAQCANLIFTGNISAQIVASLPAGVGGLYSVLNGTIGAFNVILESSGTGAAIALPQGRRVLIVSDGTNVYLADQAVAPGTVQIWLSNTIPGGFILPYGQVLAQASYPGIYAAYGNTFNTGGESGSQFRMPDLRGLTFAGLDNMGGVARGLLNTFGASGTQLGGVGGEQLHTLLTAEMPTHSHTPNETPHVHGTTESPHSHSYLATNVNDASVAGGGGTANQGNFPAVTGQTSTNLTINAAVTGITLQNTGGGGSHNNVQPTMLCNFIVKT